MSARVLSRYLVAGAAGAAVLLALPTAAGAHVDAAGETVEGVTRVAFSFHHGCDGAATTGLRIQLPEGATEVVPEDPAGWTSTVGAGELAWSGGSVPDSQEATFVATMTLTDPEGTTVFLPTIQECGTAQEAWIDKSEDPEANNAAPRITAGAVVSTGGHDDAEDSDGSPGSAPATEPEKTTNDGVGGAPAPATSAPAESNQAAPATENASSTSSSAMPMVLGIIAAIIVIGVVLWFVIARRGSSPTPPSS